MPLYLVTRTHENAAAIIEDEWEMVRLIGSAHHEPRHDWIRSFGRNESGFCIFRGPDARELGIQQRLCALPFDEIREVEEVNGAAAGPGIDEAPEGWSLYLVERTFLDGATGRLIEVNGPHAEGSQGVLWLRSYWDPERHLSRCIFAAARRDAVREAATDPSAPSASLDGLTRVTTIHPSMWAEIWDRLGLPRHWETSESDQAPAFPPL